MNAWQFHPHPEVWVLIASIIGFAVYAVKVIGPKAVRDGSPIVTRRQMLWFVLGVLVLWAAADWPVHDIGERYLYFVHMTQHLAFKPIQVEYVMSQLPHFGTNANSIQNNLRYSAGIVLRLGSK